MSINMERNVGSLQEQALKRKERLKALREKQLHVSYTSVDVRFYNKCSAAFRERVFSVSQVTLADSACS